MKRIVLAFLAIGVALGMTAVAGASGAGAKLSLVAYSTPREAYAKLIPMFQATPAGDGVSFTQSYAASGDQARAVKAGLKADVVALALAPDVTELVKAGLVDRSWDKQSYKGMVHDSVVVFVVREGNPKKVKTWDDLLKPGVEVITPNPFTSGGARWNVMAAYGAWLKLGKTKAQARAKLLQLFQHVAVQDKSARDALNTFLSGKGDVLLTYENEAIAAQLAGQKTPYVIPRSTILIENPIAVLKIEREQGDGTAVHPFSQDAGRTAGVRRPRLPADREERVRCEQEEVPQSARAVHDQPARLRGLGQGAAGLLRPGHGRDGRDREEGGRGRWLAPPQPLPSPRASRACRGTAPERRCPSAS